MDVLTESQQAELRKLLDTRETSLRSSMALSRQRTREAGESLRDADGDVGDVAFEDESMSTGIAMTEHWADEIEAISRARRRLESGTYGVCSECEQPIEMERMHSLPTAERCQKCQSIFDRTHAARRTF